MAVLLRFLRYFPKYTLHLMILLFGVLIAGVFKLRIPLIINSIIDEVITLDDNRRATQQKSDELLSRANSIAKEIGILFDRFQEAILTEHHSHVYYNNVH